jgi:Salmonella virulence plasmid 28.1kDa A protein
LDELLERRPDLGALQLTSDNTDTELPQIDLVNEILEQIVASSDGKTLSGSAIGPTTWDSADLAAQPEYLVSAAYDVLRTAVYPFDLLPFDLWAEEGRRYLRQMDIARDNLMGAMPPKAGVGAKEIATETLGMTSNEREIISKPDTKPEDLATYWGLDLTKGTLRAQLGKVETLLAQAHIDYDTLLRLLNTRYVNPGRAISVGFGATPCSLEEAVLLGADGAELADKALRSFLDRLHRFLRLQRRLAWTEYEIDMVVTALAIDDFDAEDFLVKLADLRTLHDTLDLPVSELCSWWGILDTYAFEDELPSQYEAIFLNASLFPDTYADTGPDLRNRVFALTADRSDLAIVISTDATLSRWLAQSDGATPPSYNLQADYAAYVQSATRLTSTDLLLLVERVLPKDLTTGHVALNLANTSLLYRIGSLVRALNISVPITST